MKKNILAGLDLGTTKVCAAIAEQTDGNLNILGFGVAPSEGLTRGLVANITKTAEAINEAMSIAQNRAGLEIKDLNVGVAGEHIKSLRHRNYVTINNAEKEITQSDLERLNADVRTIRIPSDKQILHIIPEEFMVDDQGNIDNPLGMSGSKLEAVNHVVLAAVPAIQNIKKSVERAGFNVKNYILQPIASSESVLDINEKDLGVVLIDIGGGTTDVAVYIDKTIKHTKMIGVAGNQVTSDIRESLGIVTVDAENLKKEFGYANQEAIIKDQDIIIKNSGGRGNVKIPITLLTQIINVRMRELFMIIDNELQHTQLKKRIKSGIVLTGGGSLLRGCTDLAEEIFGLPTRIGLPLNLGQGLSNEIESPEFATVAGLIKAIPGVSSGAVVVKEKESDSSKKNIVLSFYRKLKEIFENL